VKPVVKQIEDEYEDDDEVDISAVIISTPISRMKLQMFGTVGRATVPADTGRHGGRPYDTTRPKFLFRFDWTLAASGGARMNDQF
jgi:hypothetical protein